MSVAVRAGRVHDTDRGAAVTSLLFVAGTDEPGLRSAFASGAGAVVADLEDLVAAGRKAQAREVVTRVLREQDTTSLRMVRINGSVGGLRAEDLAALRGSPVDAIVVPKADQASLVAAAVLGLPLLPVVESAAGVRAAYELASHPGVLSLVLGLRDLAVDLGLPTPVAPEALAYARSKLVVDCAAAGAAAPFDVPPTGADGTLEAEALRARRLGFGGKICRTAEQVRTVDRVFARDA